MAMSTVNTTSAFDNNAVSDAFAFTSPTKYRLGAMMAPATAIEVISIQPSFAILNGVAPLSRILFTLAMGVSSTNATKYTNADKSRGLILATAGLATVEIEPKSTAAMKAH